MTIKKSITLPSGRLALTSRVNAHGRHYFVKLHDHNGTCTVCSTDCEQTALDAFSDQKEELK